MNRLNEIEARTNAATPGPWEAGCNDRHVLYVTTENEEFCAEYGPELYDSQGFFSDDDTEFIAHARTDVPDMAAALRAVLAIHTPVDRGRATACCTCEQWIESTDPEACIEWPCATVETIRQHIGDDL